MTTSQQNLRGSERLAPRRQQITDGRQKTLFDGPEAGTFVLYFKDQILVGDTLTPIAGKGVLCHRLSELLMHRLKELGVETHFLKRLNMREQQIRATDPYPFRIRIHNVAADDFAERMGMPSGQMLQFPVPEIELKATKAILSATHAAALGIAQEAEVEDLISIAGRVNDFVSGQFLALGMRLLSISLEFGRWYFTGVSDDFRLVLIDEISPDTCAILDLETGRRYDRSAVRSHPEIGAHIYQEVARRFGVLGEDCKYWEKDNVDPQK